MRNTTLAARYAKALFLVAEKRQETVAALEGLKGVGGLLAHGSPAQRFFTAPQVRLADKRAVLKSTLEPRVARAVVVFVDLLLRKKRLSDLPTIVEEFEALVEHSQGIQRAHLVSATPFGPAETERLQRELERYTESQIRLSSEVDSGLLGGALVRIGNRVIDRSVRTLLARIGEQLHEASV